MSYSFSEWAIYGALSVSVEVLSSQASKVIKFNSFDVALPHNIIYGFVVCYNIYLLWPKELRSHS